MDCFDNRLDEPSAKVPRTEPLCIRQDSAMSVEFSTQASIDSAMQLDIPDTLPVEESRDEEVQFIDEPEFLFDGPNYLYNEPSGEKFQLMKRISDKLLTLEDVCGYDDVDSGISTDADEITCNNIVSYMQTVENNTRAQVATYLSSGKLDEIQLSIDSIHHVFHIAMSLSLQQLRTHCLMFCCENKQDELLARFDGCACQDEILRELRTGIQRSMSIISDPGDAPPEFYIVFSKQFTNKQATNKVKVVVIDMSEKMDIFHREMAKPHQFGKGFACCSCEVKQSPFIFVSGGEGKNSQLVWKYDVLLGTWEKSTKMNHKRSKHLMVTAENGSLFVFGGQETSTVEEFNIKTRKWMEHGQLKVAVFSAVAAVFGNKIYIFGGKTSVGPMASVQCFDVVTNKISRLDDLPHAFYGGQAVVLKSKIYIATNQGHMICFDPSLGTSQLCSQQPVSRKHVGLFEKHDRIYLVGGFLADDENFAGETPQYRYNPEKDTWVEKSQLSHCFPIYTSCVVKYPQHCPVVPFNDKYFY